MMSSPSVQELPPASMHTHSYALSACMPAHAWERMKCCRCECARDLARMPCHVHGRAFMCCRCAEAQGEGHKSSGLGEDMAASAKMVFQ